MKKLVDAVIVEDEKLARDLIRNYLADHPWVKISGEYADGFSAIRAINKNRPDLIFLDIQIPKISGMEMMELLDYQPAIIFTTAFDEYAIKAFEVNGLDYLLKPYSRERFSQALEKTRIRIEKEFGSMHKSGAMIIDPVESIHRVVVKSGTQIHVIPVSEILYMEAQDDYVMIHTMENRYLKQQTMKFYEEHLDPSEFIRVHRSYIVAIDKIEKLEHYEKESYRLFLVNGTRTPVSRNGYHKLKSVLNF